MKFLKYLSTTALMIALAACGGGGAATTASNNTGTATGTIGDAVAANPAKVEVLTSANTLASAGSEVVITAFVKNGANVGMSGQAIKFSASSGTLQNPSVVTDATGAATAKLIAGSDKSLRNITVTVTAATVSGHIVVPVSGTRISIAGNGSLQAGSAAVSYGVRALDSSGNPVGQSALSVTSSLGNSVSTPSLTTDSTGAASFLYTPNKSGTDTLTISGLGTSVSVSVIVNAIDFVAVSPASNTSIPIGTSQTITVQYKDSGSGVGGKIVNFSTTRGTFVTSTSLTNDSGQAFAVLSSTTAGSAVVNAQISGLGSVNLPVQFVATIPSSIVVQANPGAVLPNATGTTNQSTIQAVVRDVNGNAVANKQVNFSVLQDLSNGTLSSGNAITDSNGRVQVQFIPGATSTPANGVRIQAAVASTGINAITTLTVNGQALFITFGLGNNISSLDETTYSKEFSVYVTDTNGVAVALQSLTLSAIPEEYFKGALMYGSVPGYVSTAWGYSGGTATRCANEDRNLDGFLDGTEDTNTDGKLTPGNITIVAPGTVMTDAFGRATFTLQYGKQFAPWASMRITARAAVAGTESRQSTLFDLVGSESDFTAAKPPVGVTSPFGTSTSCTNPN
jgi:hypothetical protein